MKSDPSYQAKWYETVKDYKESGLSMKRYASKNSIKYYQLQYWVRKYNESAKVKPTPFAKVETQKVKPAPQTVKVTYGRLKIELPEHFSESVLLKILKAADQVV